MPPRERDAQPAATRAQVVDFHNHVIPGVDDGARDINESRAALVAMHSSAVHALITTPHVDGSIVLRPERFATRMRELDAGWQALSALAQEEFPHTALHRGAEIKLDTPEPDLSDSRMRLAGTRFALVEFPYFTIPPRSTRVIAHIRDQDWIPVIAHPERYDGVEAEVGLVQQWKAAGAYLQVNGASLLGRYGSEAKSAAFALLSSGVVDYFCSDYHARGRTEILAYRDLMIELGAEDQIELLMCVNPSRLLQGDAPLSVAPLPVRRRLWDRISSAFR